MIFNKMWCVGLFASVLTVSTAHGAGCIVITPSKENTDVQYNKAIVDAVALIDTEKKLLIDDVVRIVSPHLSQEEMTRLNALLQDLARRVTVQNLFEIHKELKADVTRFGVLALFGVKIKSAPTGSETTTLEQHLQRILKNIRLVQYEQFVRTNATELSKMIARTLASKLPDCVPTLAAAATAISNLEHPDKIQKALEGFLNKNSVMLNAL